MIRTQYNALNVTDSWPRTSGDDPITLIMIKQGEQLAPHERG